MTELMRRTGKALARPSILAFLAFAAIGAATSRGVAWTDDARFYVPAAAAYADWLQTAVAGAVTLDFQPWSRARLDETFRNNREHPPVGKLVMGIGWLVLHDWTGLLGEVDACRFAVMLLWAAMCAAVFSLVRRAHGTAAGVFTGLALVFMPRVLFHAHAETLDMPVAALLVLTSASLWRCLERPSLAAGIATVVLYALALGAKLNAPFFLVAVFLYILLLQPFERDATMLRLPRIPVVVVGMALASPLITWALWPWLWFDTAARLQAYVQFHAQHYGILFYFAGVLYGEKIAPWYAPGLMAAITVPVPVLLLALAGALPPLRSLVASVPLVRRWAVSEAGAWRDDPRARFAMLVFLQAAVQIAAVSAPSVPVYGGIKLFLPAFPFLAMLAGSGFAMIIRDADLLHLGLRARRAIVAATAAALLAPGVVGVLAYGGAWLSYYNSLVGGVRGATASGFERQYYDLAYDELRATLEEQLPDGGSVAVLPNPKEYGPYFSRWQKEGRLSRRIHRALPERADLLVLTHERRWREYTEHQARYRTRPRLAQHTVHGVPMFTVYDLREP
jgi:hypothetical protein